MAKENITINSTVNSTMNINVDGNAKAEIQRLNNELKTSKRESDELSQSLENARDRINELVNALENANRASGITALKEELETFKDTAEKAATEFGAFLNSVKLTGVDGEYSGKFLGLFDDIRNGSKTAQEAIAEVKNRYAELIAEGNSGGMDSTMIQQFDASLQRLGSTMETVLQKVNEIQSGGVTISGELSSAGTSVETTLQQIESSARRMDGDLKSAYDSIANLTKAMIDYSSVDEGKLISIASTFKSMANVGNGKFSSKSLQNMIDFFSQIKTISGGNGEINLRFSGDFDKLAGLKFSSTIATNLKEFSKVIKNFNFDQAEKLSQLKFDNLAELKVSKSSVKNLAELASVYETLQKIQDKINGTGSTGSSRGSQAKILEEGTKGYADALKKIDDLQSKLSANKEKWAGAQGTELDYTYRQYTDQITALENLKTSLESGTLTSENFANQLANINQTASALGNTLSGSLVTGTQEYVAAVKKIDDAKSKIQSNIDRWGSDPQLTSNTNYQTYIDYARQLDELRAKMDSGKLTNSEYSRSFSEISVGMNEAANAVKTYIDANKIASNTQTMFVSNSKEYFDALSKVNSLLNQVKTNSQEWTAAKTGKSSDAYRMYVDQISSLEELKTKLESGQISVEEFGNSFSNIRNNVTQYGGVIRSAGEATMSFSDQVGGIVQRFSAYFGISKVIMSAVRTVKDMIRSAMEIETSMNQLQIVTGATDSQMEKFFTSSASLAKDLGKSISDVASSIETFSRLGYSLTDSSELAKFANILSNVADTDVSAATTGLTSIIKGYGMDVSDASHVADVLVQVGQKYAISAEELMEAFQRGGAALYASGTDFEKSAALFAATNASLQNAATTGTLWKAVSARLRGATTELQEMGEDTEGLADGLSKYRSELLALTGVDIMKDADHYRDLYDIFVDLAGVWDNLKSDEARSRVAEILGGTRNLSGIMSTINNIKDAMGAYNDAISDESIGVALRANEKRMETTAAHLEQMKASFQELSYDIYNADLAKGLVDGLRGVIEFFDKLIGKFGTLATVVGSFAALNSLKSIISVFRGVGGISSIGDVISGLALAFPNAANVIGAFTTALSGSAAVASSASGVFASLWALLSAHPIFAVVTAITAAVAVLKHFAKAGENANKAFDKSFTAFEESKRNAENINEELEEVKSKIEELEAKKGLTFAEESELERLKHITSELEIQKDLKEKMLAEDAKQAAKDAVKAYKKNSDGSITKQNVDGILNAVDVLGVSTLDRFTSNGISGLIAGIKYYTEERNKAIADGDQEMVDSFDTAISECDRILFDKSGEAWERVSLLEEYRSSLMDLAEYTDLSNIAGASEALSAIDEEIAFIYMSLDPAKWKDISLGRILENKEFAKQKNELVELAKANGNVGLTVQDLVSNYGNLVGVLSKNGIPIEDFINHINGEAGLLDMDKVVEQTKEKFAEIVNEASQDKTVNPEIEVDPEIKTNPVTIEEFNEWLDSLEDEDKLVVISLIADADVDKANWSLEDYKQYVEDAKKSTENYGTSLESLKTRLTGLSEYHDTVSAAISASRKEFGLTTEQIDKLSSAFGNLEGYDPAELFEQTANGVHLNADALERLNEQYNTNNLREYDALIRDLQMDIISDRVKGNDTSALESELYQAQLLKTEYEGLTSAYNKWIQAKSGGNERDSYESIGAAYKDMQATLNEGWAGDETLNAYLDLLLSAEKRTGDAYKDFAQLSEKIGDTGRSIMDYWRYDDNKLSTDGLIDFIKDVNKGLGDTYAKIGESGKWEFDFNGEKLQDVADYFGTTTEAVEIFERALIDAGATINMGDVDFSTQMAETVTIVEQLKQLTSEPITVQAEVENQEKITELATALAAMPETIQTSIGINAENVGSVDGIVNQFKNNQQSINVPVGFDPDTSKADAAVKNVDSQKVNDKTFIVKAYDQASSIISSVRNGLASLPSLKNIVIKTIYQTVGKPGQGIMVNGSAHANGTSGTAAHSSGQNWGISQDETALVNELGTESMVYGGRWNLIPGGAHFQKFKKGTIIFNHKQTEELLKNGQVVSNGGHGRVYVNGSTNAYDNGIGIVERPNYGNSKPQGGGTSGGSGGSGGSSGSGGSNNSGGTNKTTSPSSDKEKTTLEKFKEWFSTLFDWIEVKLERQTQNISRYVAKAEAALAAGKYGTSAKYYQNAINLTSSQISDHATAYDKYINQADAVLTKAQSMGLITADGVKNLKQQVANGQMAFNEYSEELQEVVSTYKDFYDKAIDAKDAIQDLHNNIRDYIKSLKDLRDAQRDAKLESIDTYSSIATSGYVTTSGKYTGLANSQLSYSNTVLGKQNDAYYDNVVNVKADTDAVGKTALSSIKGIIKKVTDKKYKQALTNAQNAIKSKKKISSSDLSVIKKNNRTVYEKLYAYNLAVDNVALARLELATVYATNSAEIYGNMHEQFENKDKTTNNQISLLGTKAQLSTNPTTANKYLEQEAGMYDQILADDDKEISKFSKEMKAQQKIIGKANSKLHGTNYKNLSAKGKASVDKYIDSAQKYAKAGKNIPANVLAKLAQYYEKGYIKLSFYEACINYNNALEYLLEAKAQKVIDQQTAKQEKLAIGTQMVANVQQYYQNKQNMVSAKTAKIENAQKLRSVRGLDMTAKDYHDLINQSKAEQSLLEQERDAVYAQIQDNVAKGLWKTSSQEYKDAMQIYYGLKRAVENCTIAQEEYNNQIAQLPYEALEKALELLDAIANYNESLVNLKSAQGLDLSEGDYIQQMQDNISKIGKLEAERAQAYTDYLKALSNADGVYGGRSAELWLADYNKYGTEINNLYISNEKLKDSMRDDVYWRNFERAHDAAKRLSDVISGIKSLISEDMYFDKNGKLTQYGVSQVANLVKEFEAARREVRNYSNDIDNLNKLYASGQYTQDEYYEKLNEFQNGLFNSAGGMKSAIEELKRMYKDMAQSELDDLLKLIDRRKDALKAKKDYYDFDKTLKDKNKNIEALEREIAALDGVTDAESRAKKARLEAQLKDAKDELDDAVREHMFDLSQDALDDLKDSLQEAFDDKWETMFQDLESIASLLAAANALTEHSAGTISATLGKILEFYGINPNTTGVRSTAGFASGTRRVGRNMNAFTQEYGDEAIISPTDRAVYTKLDREDIIPNARLSANLFKWGEIDPVDFINGITNDISKLPNTSSLSPTIVQNYDSLLNVEGNVDSTVVTDLNRFASKFYEGAYQYTQKKIVQDARRVGIKV